jgi:hypothetical protein
MPPFAAFAKRALMAVPAPAGLLLKVMFVAVAPASTINEMMRSFFEVTAGIMALSVCEAVTFAFANFGVNGVVSFIIESVALFALMLSSEAMRSRN